MKLRILIAGLGLALLAGCGKGGSGNAGSPAAPVAAKAPPAGKQWTDVVVDTGKGFRMGNPDAPIKLVEYGSRLCPTCGNFGRTGQQPLEDNYVKTGKVSYEFREYLVHNAPDVPGALLGRCGGPGPFFPLLEAMFQTQDQLEPKLADTEATSRLQQSLQGASPIKQANAWADYLGYIDFVKQRGIPESQARACLNDAKALDHIVQVMNEATEQGVTGTPTFFINGQQQPPSVLDWPSVEAALKTAGA